MSNDLIYMDYSDYPDRPSLFETMSPYFTGVREPASRTYGWTTEKLESAEQVASLINAHPKEIIFTSGATESDNLAIKGVAEMYTDKGDHIITLETEHKQCWTPARRWKSWGEGHRILELTQTGWFPSRNCGTHHG